MIKGRLAALITVLISIVVLLGSFACREVEPAATAYYQIGERVQTSREMLTVISVERTDVYKRHGPGAILDLDVEALPTTVFIIVEVTVINIGTDKFDIAPDDFILTTPGGNEFFPVDYEGRDPYPKKGLDPQDVGSAYGHVVFIVPEEMEEFELSCTIQGTPPILAKWEIEF